MIKCKYCGKECAPKGIGTHIWRKHGKGISHDPNRGFSLGTRVAWNKGLTKNTDIRLKKIGESISKNFKEHPRQPNDWSIVKYNTGRHPWNFGLTAKTDIRVRKSQETLKQKYKDGTLHGWWKKGEMPTSIKIKISKGMIRAHSNGTASCWKGKREKSYPEKFFSKVIQNDFYDKNVTCELSMRNFFIDFAWPHKKKAIEIDGSQHTRYEEQIERDKRKNQCFKDKGWEFIRVPWKEFFNNTKQTIIKLNTFIGK